jgi:hypothetical protein
MMCIGKKHGPDAMGPAVQVSSGGSEEEAVSWSRFERNSVRFMLLEREGAISWTRKVFHHPCLPCQQSEEIYNLL